MTLSGQCDWDTFQPFVKRVCVIICESSTHQKHVEMSCCLTVNPSKNFENIVK